MKWRYAELAELDVLAQFNRSIQEDEGADPMELPAIRARLERWLKADYRAVLFEAEDGVVAYALYRPTDPDTEGLQGGVFVRHFFVDRNHRRRGFGAKAFGLLTDEIWPPGCGIMLDTVYGNRRAQHFWRAVGFSEYGVSFQRAPSGG